MTGQVHAHLQDMTTVEAAAQKVPDTAVSTGGTYFQLSWYHVDMSLGLAQIHMVYLPFARKYPWIPLARFCGSNVAIPRCMACPYLERDNLELHR